MPVPKPFVSLLSYHMVSSHQYRVPLLLQNLRAHQLSEGCAENTLENDFIGNGHCVEMICRTHHRRNREDKHDPEGTQRRFTRRQW